MNRSLQRPGDESGERSSTPCLVRISFDETRFEEKTLETGEYDEEEEGSRSELYSSVKSER